MLMDQKADCYVRKAQGSAAPTRIRCLGSNLCWMWATTQRGYLVGSLCRHLRLAVNKSYPTIWCDSRCAFHRNNGSKRRVLRERLEIYKKRTIWWSLVKATIFQEIDIKSIEPAYNSKRKWVVAWYRWQAESPMAGQNEYWLPPHLPSWRKG